MKLSPSKTYIVLFTRGRIDRQKTLRGFTPAMLRQTIVVTAESELESLKSAHEAQGWEPLTYVGFDDEVRLNVKRFLMASWITNRGGSRYLMVDDDLLMSVALNGKYKTARSEEGQEALDEHWRAVNGLWKDFDGVGFSAAGRNNRNFLVPQKVHEPTGLHIQTNSHNALFYGFKTALYHDMFSPFYDHGLLKDMAWTDLMSQFMLNTSGETTGCRVYDIAWTTSFQPKDLAGGMSVHRTVKTNERAVFIMKLFFPNVIASRTPTPGYFDNFTVDRQVYKPVSSWKRFDWEKSYKEVQRSFMACDGSEKGGKALFPESHRVLRHYLGKLADMAEKKPGLDDSKEAQLTWLNDLR